MTDPALVMVDRTDPGQTVYETEAEPVLVVTHSETVRMTLDDGIELVFDREDLLACLGIEDRTWQRAVAERGEAA